jgi:hypothetical protein
MGVASRIRTASGSLITVSVGQKKKHVVSKELDVVYTTVARLRKVMAVRLISADRVIERFSV